MHQTDRSLDSDKPGTWQESDDTSWIRLREAVVPVDITADGGFVHRMVAAVQSYGKPVHGIVTVSNALLVPVSKGCEALKLPSSPSGSLDIAVDKFKIREMEPDDGGAFRIHNIEGLKDRITASDKWPLEYPLIVKPCIGWGSECVAKVHNEAELIQAVTKASSRHRDGPTARSDVMIEPYIEGPEVDFNLVLLDGEIIFHECCDDFPSPGDQSKDWKASFEETIMAYPSALPPNEIETVRDSLKQTLLRQGFRNGVFHCEGRIRYSSMAFSVQDGTEDLYPDAHAHAHARSKEPSFYLHEINPRPGGYFVSVAANLTYGVDYYALHLLDALADWTRYRALSHPFRRGAQWHLALVIIPEDRAGIMKSEDAGKELLERHADLKAAVPDYVTMLKKGSKLLGPDSPIFSYLAYFSIVSRRSRRDALELARKVQQHFTYELE